MVLLRFYYAFIQESNNVEMYKRLHNMLADLFSSNHSESGPVLAANQRKQFSYSQGWVDEASKAACMRFEKLDSDLRSYKSNSIKESIRRGHCDMGKHYLQIGKY